MMNTNDNLKKILLTLEQIRSEKYPNVSKEIVENIINIQFEKSGKRIVDILVVQLHIKSLENILKNKVRGRINVKV